MGSLEPLVKVYRPLAGNVVGDFDVAHLASLKVLGDHIISVDIAIMRLEQSHVIMIPIPFSALQISNSGWKDKTVTRADRFNNATCKVVLSSARICLIDRVEFITAACDLDLLLK